MLTRTLLATTITLSLLTTSRAADPLPTLDQAISSHQDLWGDYALKLPEGPTYEFFAHLLPPLRYVDAPFRHYPIVLSEPAGKVKARLLSNGSAINALARQPNWRGEIGTPIAIRVGQDRATFGEGLRHLDGPKYERGYLPIVHLRYNHNDESFQEEVFASCDPKLAASGAVFAKFTPINPTSGRFECQIENSALLANKNGVLQTPDGKILAAFDSKWTFNLGRNLITAHLTEGQSATAIFFTTPPESAARPTPAIYDAQHQLCIDTWEKYLAQGTQITTPEPVVNNAYRATLIGTQMLRNGDLMRYSAGNQYAGLYIAEGGDTIRALALCGQFEDARRLMPAQFAYTRKNLEFHQAAHKLEMLAMYYWLTRDTDYLKQTSDSWHKELNVILNGREKETGLLPREKYCGDIATLVYSFNSNSNTWRALRDWSIITAEIGEADFSKKLTETSTEFRKSVLAALDKATRRDVTPPFIPIALSGEEQPYDNITAYRMGSYWNIMINYVLGSGVFNYDSEPATAILQYMQQHRGVCMGMNRAFPEPTFWMSQDNVNDLYGLRYALTLQERDEPDRALVSFYGKLAQGFTRDTFIGAEGSCLRPLDEFGRQFYLPPNSASNANFLQQLRYLLVQDWDLDNDGRPETLRLLHNTPRAWLADGADIKVDKAPTAFGEVAIGAHSRLSEGAIDVTIKLPPRKPDRTLLRLRLPNGWKLKSAQANNTNLKLSDAETVDLTALTGEITIHASVSRALSP